MRLTYHKSRLYGQIHNHVKTFYSSKEHCHPCWHIRQQHENLQLAISRCTHQQPMRSAACFLGFFMPE